MLHVRSTVFVALLALGTATTTVPLDAWAKKGKKGAKKKAGKADEAQTEGDQKAGKANKKAARKAARMEKVGKAAYVKGKYDDALLAFEAAFEANPQPKHLYNIARCHEQKGNLSKAADFYERYLREAPDAEDREDVETRAELLTKKLKATMGRLDVASTPAGAVVQVKGEGYSGSVKTPWSGWLEPGRYELSALLTGYEEQTEKVGLVAGDDRKVEIDFAGKAEASTPEPPVAAVEPVDEPTANEEPRPEPGSQPPEATEPLAKPGPATPVAEVAAATPEDVPPAEEGSGIGLVPLAAFGLAAVGLASWGVFGGLHLAKSVEVDEAEAGRGGSGKTRAEMQDIVDSSNLLGAVANVSLAVAGAAGLAGGAILLFGGDGDATTAAVRWTW